MMMVMSYVMSGEWYIVSIAISVRREDKRRMDGDVHTIHDATGRAPTQESPRDLTNVCCRDLCCSTRCTMFHCC